MLKNYFKIAFRNLRSGGWYSALNIGGLGVVLAVSLLLFWWVKDELSFDSFHQDADRIYRVNSHFGKGEDENTFSDTPPPVAILASKSIPGVRSALRIGTYRSSIFRIGNKSFKEKSEIAFTDENFLDFFSGFKVLYGDRKNPFPTTTSVILTEELAQRFFGVSDATGKYFTSVEDNQTFTVGAVIANIPDNSSLRYKMYIPMRVNEQAYKAGKKWKTLDENWGIYDFETYLKLDDDIDPVSVAGKITSIKKAVRLKNEDEMDYQLQPLLQLHLYTPEGKNSGMQQVNILGLIAFLLLSIGCINYVNLTTARATRRNKEVGIRKIVGAHSQQLAGQLLVESLLTLSLSLIVSIILIQVLLPFYKNITGKTGDFSLLDMNVWLVLLSALVLTVLLAGIYPAMMVAGFSPIQALRGRSLQHGNSGLRKGLVITQFALTTMLISSTFIIGSQLRYIRDLDSGISREYVFSFDGKGFSSQFKQALSYEPDIKSVSTSTESPVNVMTGTTAVEWDGKDANRMLVFALMSIDEEFIPDFKIKVIEGKNFDGSPSDSIHFILNEMAVKQAGITNPVGKRLKFEGREGTITGVVKDFHITSIHETIWPLVINSLPKNNNLVHVRTTGQSAAKAVAAAEKLWKKLVPGYPFEYIFLDEAYNNLYKAEQQTGDLFNFFAGIAVIISCLGLLGLVSFTAEQRTKEIGIRKVLGASVLNITTLLSADFVKLVIIAILIALPVAWYAMDIWLNDFAYKVTIQWWTFVFAGLFAVVTALITVSFQSIKAALKDPVKSLRSE
ncbi:ABC transporter permease [Dyadobacter sp. NIV53]|uniref:ABC transporter permease n=1 Tax=Dyadobacter sp. NIV53 TaxID=2861765 RepID=UPI001C87DE4F|nr:ABC transporter permease [Dyadobacter sp. NIV53]